MYDQIQDFFDTIFLRTNPRLFLYQIWQQQTNKKQNKHSQGHRITIFVMKGSHLRGFHQKLVTKRMKNVPNFQRSSLQKNSLLIHYSPEHILKFPHDYSTVTVTICKIHIHILLEDETRTGGTCEYKLFTFRQVIRMHSL